MLPDMSERNPNLTRSWVSAKKSMARLLLGQMAHACFWQRYGAEEAKYTREHGGRPIIWADAQMRRKQELGILAMKLGKAVDDVCVIASSLDQAMDEYYEEFGDKHVKQ